MIINTSIIFFSMLVGINNTLPPTYEHAKDTSALLNN